MRCTEARPLFTLHLDNAVTGVEMHAVSDHISSCVECKVEYRKLEQTRLLVTALGRRPVPADLSLKLRLALSRERSRDWRRVVQSYMVRLENSVNTFMFPATAGILTAIIFFGALTGFFVPAQVGAGEIVPGIYSPARLQPPQSAMSSVADTDLNLSAPVVVQAYVDASGRVENYDIISGPDTNEVRSQLNRALLLTSFYPAYAFGQPVAGTAIICFSHVNVKG
ncbi:MAG TPA: zf-HC2 domain-containing protein [Candidatus Angelobacter sp.]